MELMSVVPILEVVILQGMFDFFFNFFFVKIIFTQEIYHYSSATTEAPVVTTAATVAPVTTTESSGTTTANSGTTTRFVFLN